MLSHGVFVADSLEIQNVNSHVKKHQNAINGNLFFGRRVDKEKGIKNIKTLGDFGNSFGVRGFTIWLCVLWLYSHITIII